MKTKNIVVSLAIAGLIIVSAFSCGQKTDKNVFTAGEFRRMELLNRNPYAIFGKDAAVTMTSAEEKSDYVLRVSGKDKDGNLISMELDAQTGVARLFDKDGMLIGEELLGADQKARWFTQDRFAEKYYPHSPYSYAVGNPAKYIDVNGDSILIYLFIDGQRQQYHWTQNSKGAWGFHDSSGNAYSGNDAFVTQLSSSLSDLMNGGAVGYDLVSGIANHSNTVTIGQADRSGAYNNNQLGWNPTGIRKDGSTEAVPTNSGLHNSPIMTLGHELGHFEDRWSGNTHKTWFTAVLPSGTTQDISTSEIYTTHLENKLRAEHNLPLRSHYLKDATGGIGPRIIDAGGLNQSVYYEKTGATVYERLITNRYKY